MDTVFMNSENSKTPKPHVLILKLTNKLDLRMGETIIALSNLSICYTWKNIKSSYNNNKFKISAPTWNGKFELPDGSYPIPDIRDYFEYILKNMELLTPETMKLLGSTKNKITEDKNVENVPHLEITEIVLVYCDIVNNDYKQDSRVLYTFVPNKPLGSLLEISPTNHIF